MFVAALLVVVDARVLFIFRFDTFRPRFTLLREKTNLQFFIYPGSEKAIMSFIRKITCYSLLILSILSAAQAFAGTEDRVTIDRDIVFRRERGGLCLCIHNSKILLLN